jgi:predicted transcriptional regulator
VEEAKKTSPETLLRDVHLGRRLDDDFDGIVVVQGNKPVGLLMHYHLIRILNSQSHRARFFEQPVSSVMDSSPLIVESGTPLEKVAKQVASREKRKLYDHVLVTEEGVLMGTVPMKTMFEKLAMFYEERNTPTLEPDTE